MAFVPDFLRKLLARPRLWIGVALFFGGLAVFGTTEDPFKELGLALATAMVVAVAADALIGEEILGRVGNAVSRIIEALQGLTILGQAEAAGVHGILMRLDPRFSEMFDAIDVQMRSGKGELRLIGVAAPSLFCGDGRQRFGRWMHNSTLGARIILVDPESSWARIRQRLEEGHSTIDDTRTAITFLTTQSWSNRIQLQPTDIPLPAFVVITDEWAFVEPYPLARVEGALGGRTPMLKLKRGSSAYDIWSETFEFIWKYPRMQQLDVYAQAPSGHP